MMNSKNPNDWDIKVFNCAEENCGIGFLASFDEPETFIPMYRHMAIEHPAVWAEDPSLEEEYFRLYGKHLK
ncbi:hypothetical protein HOT81_gp008 [Gordonia phage Fryberger]|uniref:Uncharacterized protein n=1 Tax=Gordonia phage Fryberger TaxID=2250392 RepID=A0A346FCG3_9CAUD|nr:hypothetical protein HOT81_gp008 [Gordonia phage Fryberger]AXN53427.1 hypothetical protein SEA_FRYBERGER_8 [Gordonia phage Fryberger]